MSGKQQSILLGGLVAALLSTSYLSLLNCFCCAGIIIGALVSTWHYTSTNNLTIPAGEGAGMGALVGLIGAVIGAILTFLLRQLGIDDTAAMMGIMEQVYGNMMSEEQLEQTMEQIRAQSESFSIMNLLIGAVVGAIVGAIGGAIGASVFKKGGAEPEPERV